MNTNQLFMHKYLLQGLLSVTALLGGVLLFATPTLAADTIVGSNGDYLDTDGDGTVDVIRWTMDENVTACTYDAADWTVNTASQMNITITGLDCAGDDTILDIEVSADENETGAATAPVISYANAGTLNSVTLAGGNMGPHASVTTDDLAAPVIVSTTPISAVLEFHSTQTWSSPSQKTWLLRLPTISVERLPFRHRLVDGLTEFGHQQIQF